ncbi:MAG TPA: YqgE/AlgH family protein [Bryobacteraceae bacterium]|nr:YqgE/AlgH family protein [Bryobacteraceae bacterium]
MMLLRPTVALLTAACCLTAQSRKPEDLAQGKILVTPRNPPDPHFADSVILLARYNESGAVGLMVNRRTEVPVSRVLKELQSAAKHSEPVYVGGPVELDTVMALARAPKTPDGADRVLGDIHLLMAKAALEKALGERDANNLHVYLGYCGWGPHQLENEMRLGGWFIFDRSVDLAFDSDPETLWTRMIARTEQQIVRLAFIPPGR